MPLYDFEHPETGEVKELVFGMNEEKKFIDENKTRWVRLFASPNSAIDTEIDPYSATDFKKVTENKKGSYGDMIDRSKELSEKRKSKEGRDPVQQKWFKDWSKNRSGQKHPMDR